MWMLEKLGGEKERERDRGREGERERGLAKQRDVPALCCGWVFINNEVITLRRAGKQSNVLMIWNTCTKYHE